MGIPDMTRILNIFNPTQWYILLVAAGAFLALAGAGAWYAHSEGKEAGRAEVQAKWDKQRLSQADANNRSLMNQAEKIATLSTELMDAERAQTKVIADLARARAVADSRARVLRARAATDELAARVAAAEREKLNEFATRAYAAAVRGRDAVAELGLRAGGYVEAAAAAHAEHARAEALVKFVTPRMPAGPFQRE
jgi:hypothetical protein